MYLYISKLKRDSNNLVPLILKRFSLILERLHVTRFPGWRAIQCRADIRFPIGMKMPSEVCYFRLLPRFSSRRLPCTATKSRSTANLSWSVFDLVVVPARHRKHTKRFLATNPQTTLLLCLHAFLRLLLHYSVLFINHETSNVQRT